MKTNFSIFSISFCIVSSVALSYVVNYWRNSTLERIQLSEIHITTEKRMLTLIEKQNNLIATMQKDNNSIQSKIKMFEEKLLILSDSKSGLLRDKVKNQFITTKQEQGPILSESEQQCQLLMKQVDYSSLKNIFIDAESDNFETKQRALKAIALVGSPEQKQKIEQVISDAEQDISLRRELIKSADWNGYGSGLIDLFKGDKESTIRADIISAAETSSLSLEDKESFESTLLDNFSQESNDVVKIATIDYLANTNQEQLSSFVNALDMQTLSSEVKQHIQSLQIF